MRDGTIQHGEYWYHTLRGKTFNSQRFLPDEDSITHNLSTCVISSLESLLEWMAEANTTTWARAREAEDVEGARRCLGRIYIRLKRLEKGFGGMTWARLSCWKRW